MEVRIDDRELVALSRRLAMAGKYTEKNRVKVLKTIGLIVGNEAVAKAPRSMTKTEYESTLKGRGKNKQAGMSVGIDFGPGGVLVGRTQRKGGGRAKTKRKVFTSGSLKSSITAEVKTDSVHIGVPSNSKAQAYAEKIHDERGQTWKNIGWQNDSKATDKYIYKAEEEKAPDYMRAVNALVDKIIAEI